MAAKTTNPIGILLEMGIDLDNLSDEEDYLSALIKATNSLTSKNPDDPRIGPLIQEIKKVRKKAIKQNPKIRFDNPRPKLKRKRLKADKFFDRRQPERTTEARSNQEGSSIGSGQSIGPENLKMPEAEEGKLVKREPDDVLNDILGGVISILETLKDQNKLSRERAEKDRKQLEKGKRTGKEDKLEKGPLEKFVNTAKNLVKPVQGLFDGLFKFIKNVLIGRLLFKIIGWLSDPKNTEKLKAIGEFFKATWPALLAAFIVFKLKFGGFVGLLVKTIAGFIPKLLGLIPKIFKGVVGLAKLAIANPIAASVIGGTVLAALGAVAANQPGSATVKDPDDPEKSQMDEINEAGGMRGAPMSLDIFSDLPEETTTPQADSSSTEPVQMKGGGKVPGSGPNKDTVPAMLAPGEFVISRGAVQKYGSDTFAAMNAAGGGTNLPERMNGITYAVGGGPMGSMSDYGYEEKNEEQSSTVKNEMNKRRERGSAFQSSTNSGGIFGGIKKFFGGGGDNEKKDDGEDTKTKGGISKNAKALLNTIRWAEGTLKPDGYNTWFGGRSDMDLTSMTINEVAAEQKRRLSAGEATYGQYTSAAVGAYQMMTPEAFAAAAGLSGDSKFTPENQDKMAIAGYMMGQAGMSAAEIDAPISREQIAKMAPVWASLPNMSGASQYGQPVKKYEDLVSVYEKNQKGLDASSFTATTGIAAAPGASSGVGKAGGKSHTKTLSSIVGGVGGQMMKALGDAGSGGLFKSTSSSGSSIEPPHTTTLSTIMKRTGSGMGSSGSSSSSQNSPTRPADASPPNTIPPIDAEAMISHEKIKVLGIVVG